MELENGHRASSGTMLVVEPRRTERGSRVSSSAIRLPFSQPSPLKAGGCMAKPFHIVVRDPHAVLEAGPPGSRRLHRRLPMAATAKGTRRGVMSLSVLCIAALCSCASQPGGPGGRGEAPTVDRIVRELSLFLPEELADGLTGQGVASSMPAPGYGAPKRGNEFSRDEALYLRGDQITRIIPILGTLKHRQTVSGSGVWRAHWGVDAVLTGDQKAEYERYASAVEEPSQAGVQSSRPWGGGGPRAGPGFGEGSGPGGGPGFGAGAPPGGPGGGSEQASRPPKDELTNRSEQLERQVRELDAFIAALQSRLKEMASVPPSKASS